MGREAEALHILKTGLARQLDSDGGRASLWAALGNVLMLRVAYEETGVSSARIILCQDRCDWVTTPIVSGQIYVLKGSARAALLAFRNARRHLRMCVQRTVGPCPGWVGSGAGERDLITVEGVLWGTVGEWQMSISCFDRLITNGHGGTGHMFGKCQVSLPSFVIKLWLRQSIFACFLCVQGIAFSFSIDLLNVLVPIIVNCWSSL